MCPNHKGPRTRVAELLNWLRGLASLLAVGWWIVLRRWSVQTCHDLPEIRTLTSMRLQPRIDDLSCRLCVFFGAFCGYFQ